ncbi:hypothetical protein BC834DRAFT_580864 [Gloeopeniophorella convolvens]|nr:hypothetical protein BC834DRAFT_580864 [Gloeopeniophorella convolvens]
MTPRPSFASKRRPLSAIFVGAGPSPSPSDLPDLPEPPSPGASSSNSGLPSPPATNSTGSGSAGDSRENLEPPSAPSSSSASIMRNGNHERRPSSRSSRNSSPAGGDSKNGDDDDDEDNTARLNFGRRRGASQSSDHVVTLQRVMSLTQRNRMALDKLSSMRLNTPSPSQSSRASRSPNTAATSSAASSSGARSRSVDPTLSGSETERESGASYSYSSDDQSVTPPSSVSQAYSALEGRLRRTSLPTSPSKSRVASSNRSFSPGPSQRTPKKRVSIMSMPDPDVHGEDDPHDVTSAALAAVASLRRSPSSGGKKIRQPLPREFHESRRANSDGRTSKEPTTPQKRERHTSLASDGSPSRRPSSRAYVQNQYSPHRPSHANRSTPARKHQTRWMSEDLRSSSRSVVDDEEEEDPPSTGSELGRRQSGRGGSMETTLGTRLVGDSLRAAGMSIRGGGDVFREPEQTPANPKTPRRPMSNGTSSSQEQDTALNSSRANAPSRSSVHYDPRTPANNGTSQYRTERGSYSGPQPRPSTSMADVRTSREDFFPPKTAPPGLRTYKSSYTFERDREGIGSRQGSQTPFTAPQERTYGSPHVRPRGVSSLPLDEQALEHLRLMDESLVMFETLLSRLPPMGDTTTSTVPELFRNAQAVVRFSEQVNGMLRSATNRALERLIDSEVADTGADGEVDMVGLWKDVGGDFRDTLRVSDELVRTMTGFMLGVGKVLRESAAIGGGGGAGMGASSSLQHLRGASEDLARRSSADGRSSTSAGTGKGSNKGSTSADGGRRSAESRRSWDPARVERDKADLLRRASSRTEGGPRAVSSMLLRERDAPSHEQSVGPEEDVSPPPASRALASSMRRMFTGGPPREGTPSAMGKPDLVTIESQRSLHIEDSFEPSPTPAPRARQPHDGSVRKLPPLAIPAPLPALPSESNANASSRSTTSSNDKATARRKISAASITTVRGASSSSNPGLNITTPSATATTAVTTHTVAPAAFPLTRTESAESSSSASSSRRSATVTFSRPLTVSVNALRAARTRTTSGEGQAPARTPLSATSPWTPRSGSETERPPRGANLTLGRRTLGAKTHLSLDAPPGEAELGGAQTVSHASTRKERRRTLTEIFS